jgi:hypothetical protein
MISWVDVSLKTHDRLVLMVEERPFFYNGIQIRVDKLRDAYGYTDEQIKNCFFRAGKDGFTVTGVQILWQDIQPDISFKAIRCGDSPEGTFADFDLSFFENRDIWSAAKLRVYADRAYSMDKELRLYGVDGDVYDLGTTPSWDPVDKPHYYDFDVTKFVNTRRQKNKRLSFAFKSGTDTERPPELFISRKDVFDWTWVDKILHWTEDADIKLEILWFGSDTCSVSADHRIPFYVFHDCQLARKRDGSPFFEKRPAEDIVGCYYYLLCKNDPLLREYEQKALNTLFNHIAEYDATQGGRKTVIGCQVSNEPAIGRLHGSGVYADDRCYCKNCNDKFGSGDLREFKDRTMWEFNNNLAEAVKQSAYPVWTRCNNYNDTDAPGTAYNEKMRRESGTNLDFIGLDPYSDDPAVLFAYGHGVNPKDEIDYSQGRNLPLVMENGGECSNSAKLVLASLAGGAFYTMYDFCGPDGHGLYDDVRKTGSPVPHGAYITEVRNTNSMLNKMAHILATKKSDGAGGSSLLFFNPLSVANVNETKKICSMEIQYESANGVGIVSIDNSVDGKKISALVLLSTAAAIFSIKELNTGSGGTIRIRTEAFDCVRIII